MTLATSVGVIGAGVGGLTLALICRHLGIGDVRIYREAAPEADNDHVLELSSNATRVLHAAGLKDGLREAAIEPQFSFTRTAHGGILLTQRPLGAFSVARYGAPTYLITRSKLLNLLESACRARDVCFAADTVTEITPESGELRFADDTRVVHGAVVGCDGIHSQVRDVLSSSGNWTSDPSVCVISARTTAAPTGQAINIWSGPDRYCVQYPVSDSRTDLLLVFRPGAMSLSSPEAAIQAALHNWHPRLQECMEKVTDTCNHTVIDSEPLEYWYAGKVALLGDACHPLPIYSAQGACAAIEDAWVLGTMMERWEESPAEGFSDYQRYRLPRAKKLRRAASIAAAELLKAGRSDIWRRNIKWALTNRFLPEMSMQALDWLYGYDCIKGFD